MHRYNSQYPIRLQQQPAEKEARSYVEESSAPRDVPTFDRAIQTAVDDYLVASLAAAAQPKVEDSLECSATSNLTFPGVDMTPLFEHEAAQHELHTRPPVSDFNKSTHELVTEAMLEESSPIALMNCPSALDPLF